MRRSYSGSHAMDNVSLRMLRWDDEAHERRARRTGVTSAPLRARKAARRAKRKRTGR